MNVLVTGGTGTVGSQTVRNLAGRGLGVGVMTRDASRALQLPQGVTAVVGDLEKPTTLANAFRGYQSLFLITAVSQTETQQGLAGVEAAKAAGMRRVVYLSVPIPPGSEHIPHFASKIPIENALRASGLEWTILRPNNFYQNDLWFREAIAKFGLYPQPIGSRGLNRVDVRDIADAAANALTQNGHDRQEYPLHGPDALTGADVARIWGHALGRNVRYAGDDLDAWAANALRMLPDWMVHDFRFMYDYFQKNGFRPATGDFELQRRGVGHDPRRFEDFVAEVAPGWKA